MINQIIEEIKSELEWSPKGKIDCVTWQRKGWKAVVEDEKITIYYSKNYQIARALLIIKSKGAKNGECAENSSFDSIGYMADCSRNAVLKVETVKKLIRNIAMLGYNELQLYVEDTYEVSGEPMFGYLRGRYTKAEMKEMNSYAQIYQIDIVPCIQTLAHLNQLKRWAQYDGLFDCNDILLCGDERVYKLIENMFATLAECFSSRNVHLGMDEAHMLGRGRYLRKNGYEDPVKIFIAHLNRVNSIAEKYGFKPMIWGDMIYSLLNNGRYCDGGNADDVKFSEEILALLPKTVDMVYWDYYNTETAHYDKMFKTYAQLPNEVRFASGVWKFSGWVPHNTYAIHTINASIPAVKANGIKKIMTTGWGDDGAECSTFSILPALANFSLQALSQTKEQIDEQFLALTGYSIDDFMKIDDLHKLFSKSPVKKPMSFTKNALYNDLFMGYLDKLHKGENKEYFRQAITNMQEVAKGKYEYIFNTLIALGEVLDVKYDMGIRLHEAYEKEDKQALKAIMCEMDVLVERVQEFYQIFRTQWYSENKPQGFEVQDIRLGGLKMRVQNCKQELQEFLDGKRESIPALEEELLEEAFGKCTLSDFLVNNWYVNCTANVLS